MRVRGRSRLSARTSKRKNEAESSTTAASEPQPKRMSRGNEGEQKEPSSSKTRGATVSSSVMVDKYCWICHTETDDKICVTCHRAFHHDCLKDKKYVFTELGVCTECQSKSVNGTELNFNKFFNLDKLKRMLDVLTRRSFDKKRKKNEPFLSWPEEDRDELFKIIDFEILLDNINHVPPYTNTAEFYGDVKFMYHNSCIAYGAHSEQAKAMENLRRDFKTELLDLEACPECYYHMYCDESDSYDPFIRLCDSPHDIVWAQLHGHPSWPAKCLKVVKGIAHVRFFGEHEQANVPVKKCFFMSESHPKYKNSNINSSDNSGPKSDNFKSARIELLRYIHLYQRKYGDFPFYPHKTPYKPQDKQNEVNKTSTEGSLARNMVQMKLEGINEDTEANVINAVPVFSENFPNDASNEIGSSNGQYPTSDELLSSFDANATFLDPASVDSGLNTNHSSPVTRISMSFNCDDPSNIENVPTQPIVTSIESLEHIQPPPVTLPPAGDTSLSCDFSLFEGILHSEATKINETIEQSDQFELDNEVQCIGQKINVQADDTLNPHIILPLLEESSPELKPIIQKARYWIDGLLIHLWANCNKNSEALGKLSKMSVDLRKLKSSLKKFEEENIKFKKEIAEQKLEIRSLTNQLQLCESDKKNLESNIQKEITRRNEAAENAKTIINSLKTGCSRQIEEILRRQFMDTIREKEEKLQTSEKIIRSLKEEVEESKKAKEKAEDRLKVTKSKEAAYDIDEITGFKTMHFCKLCEQPAAVTCCLNTSYCSPECQEQHAEEHLPLCRKPKISSQIVQKTVCEKTISLSYSEMSTVKKSSNPQEISTTNSAASSTHPKKPRISASPMLPIPHDPVLSSPSRPAPSKVKKIKKQR